MARTRWWHHPGSSKAPETILTLDEEGSGQGAPGTRALDAASPPIQVWNQLLQEEFISSENPRLSSAPRPAEGCGCRAGGRGCRRSHTRQPCHGHGGRDTAAGPPAVRSSWCYCCTQHGAGAEPSRAYAHLSPREKVKGSRVEPEHPLPWECHPAPCPLLPLPGSPVRMGPDQQRAPGHCETRAGCGPRLPTPLQEQYPHCRNTNKNNKKVDAVWVFPSIKTRSGKDRGEKRARQPKGGGTARHRLLQHSIYKVSFIRFAARDLNQPPRLLPNNSIFM